MKRLIKFRAWCRQDNMMYCDIQNGITFDDHSVYTFNDFLDRDDYHEWEIMQFTGLHDKNGKEIYEGDIIQWGGENEPMVVAWSDKYASFGIHRSGWMYMHFFGEAVDNTDCEVIGDIYSNPELIER